MQRIVSSKTAEANEVSVSSNIAEQPPTPDSRGVNRCEPPERARDYSDAHTPCKLEANSVDCSAPMHEANRLFCSAMGREACGVEGSVMLLETSCLAGDNSLNVERYS